jgi:hypothetical protein
MSFGFVEETWVPTSSRADYPNPQSPVPSVPSNPCA